MKELRAIDAMKSTWENLQKARWFELANDYIVGRILTSSTFKISVTNIELNQRLPLTLEDNMSSTLLPFDNDKMDILTRYYRYLGYGCMTSFDWETAITTLVISWAR